jgi:hypothetical protein
VSIENPGSTAFNMLDLPTPELPVKTLVFPLRSSVSSDIPSPVTALVLTTL